MARTGKEKTPAQVLFQGNDARISAIRNNLVRKQSEIIEAIGKLTDAETEKLVAYVDFDAMVKSAQDVRAAVKARAALVKPAPAPTTVKAS